ncbi:MAG: type III pantothenate kinase, partial [Nevskia sp.]|nr:type III pantothenate kinase [Nevskia sp.]
MSLLLLDVGNSRVKWALAGPSGIGPSVAVAHQGVPVSAAKAIDATGVEAIWIANVTGSSPGEQLACELENVFDVEPRFAKVQPEFAGLRAGYDEPQRLGVDRWLCLLAAWSEISGAACVASAGTALTF